MVVGVGRRIARDGMVIVVDGVEGRCGGRVGSGLHIRASSGGRVWEVVHSKGFQGIDHFDGDSFERFLNSGDFFKFVGSLS